VAGLTASELRAAAAYLGVRPARLRAELRVGRTMREIAREHGTTVAAVRRAVLAAMGR
jgi:predicted transcriptional regulator